MSSALRSPSESVSHRIVRERYTRPSSVGKYPAEYTNRRRDRREKACILKCLTSIPAGGHVLDLPCGAGRLTQLLVERGHRVTGVDISERMVSRAREKYEAYQKQQDGRGPTVRFEIRDVLATGFATDEFDGVTCIRLLHHFAEAETRRQALAELRRVSRGPIVVSFLNSFALDRFALWLKVRMPGRERDHQLPIPMKAFAADVEDAGLQIDKKIAAHWGISSRWFLVLSRRKY